MVALCVVSTFHHPHGFYSFTISPFSWSVKIEYGCRLRCWTSVGSHHATSYRQARLQPVPVAFNNVFLATGTLADNSISRFGRRRPYMLLGTLICMGGMLLLGFTRPIASLFTSWETNAVCFSCVYPTNFN